jgi:hypothetical protein
MLIPFISLLPFMGRNLPQKFVVLKRGPEGKNGYNTIALAEADGAVTLNYGYVALRPSVLFRLKRIIDFIDYLYVINPSNTEQTWLGCKDVSSTLSSISSSSDWSFTSSLSYTDGPLVILSSNTVTNARTVARRSLRRYLSLTLDYRLVFMSHALRDS